MMRQASALSLFFALSLLVLPLALSDDYIPAYLQPVDGLKYDTYLRSCPNMEAIVQNKVKQYISKDYTYGAALIHLLFRDCIVRGCDASILLDAPGAERYASTSTSLRGFDIIDDIKTAIESQCPNTVSCSDILVATARDAVYAIGGPYWQNKYGRKDGTVSLASEAEGVPMGHESITDLINLFQSKGLNIQDLVVLLGSHTIGQAQCSAIQYRLYNFLGSGKPDPTINQLYLNFLQRKCSDANNFAELDPTTPTIFDNVYYKNLQQGLGTTESDQLLIGDSRTGPIAEALANHQPDLFYRQYGVAMFHLTRTQVLTGDGEGEIRLKCSANN